MGMGNKMSELKEAVAYARYSNKLSSDRSIEDQFQLCEKIAKQHGYKIVKFFEDRAVHGAGTLGRAGWLALMRAATSKDRTFDAVIVESMSRMSRDLADSARDFKRIAHREIELIDLEGVATTMRVGMSGILCCTGSSTTSMSTPSWLTPKERTKNGRSANMPPAVIAKRPNAAFNVTIEKINRIVDAMADGDMPLAPLKEKLKALELERAGHEEKVRMAEADGGGKVVTLHPSVIKNFRKNLEAMHSALTNTTLTDAEVAPFRVAFGNVFDRVVVHKTGKRKPVEVTPYARVSAIMAETNLPRMRAPKEVLEEQGLTNLFLATHGTLEQLGW